MSIDIITNALEYYDKNTEKYENVISRIKYYKLIKNNSDLEHNKINFYDKNKELIFQSRYEVLGLYDPGSKTWIWAWSVPRFFKNQTYLSRKILNYGLDIIPEKDINFLKSELISSRFKISNDIQLDLHVSIASYISKSPLIYKLRYKHLALKEDLITVREDDDESQEFLTNYLYLLDFKEIK